MRETKQYIGKIESNFSKHIFKAKREKDKLMKDIRWL